MITSEELSFVQNSFTKSVWAITAGGEEIVSGKKFQSKDFFMSQFTYQLVESLDPSKNYALRNKKVIDLVDLFSFIKKNMSYSAFEKIQTPHCGPLFSSSQSSDLCGVPMFSSNNYIIEIEKKHIVNEKNNFQKKGSILSEKILLSETKNYFRNYYKNLKYSSFDEKKNSILSECFVDLFIKKFENDDERKNALENEYKLEKTNQKEVLEENISLEYFWKKCTLTEKGKRIILIEGKAGIGKVSIITMIIYVYYFMFI